jgi:nitrogen-specific signal transduction histidine kinase/CheY-like chemotaxis protein
MTERREAQIALQKAQAERDRAQRMEALGHLTGGVAHDFNNLLMIVSGHLHVLKNLGGCDPKGERAVSAIESAMRRGQSLTRQLLTFSRRQSLNPVPVEIGKRIDGIRAMLESSVGSTCTMAIYVFPDLWPIVVDPDELELALLNLALNARDSMPGGGTITVSATNMRLEPGEVSENLSGEFVGLCIADTGCGIAPDLLSRIFDPFFTTKHSGEGTGLGLAQVHGFAHQSGGTITVASELGKGTRFTLYLPRGDCIAATEVSQDAEPAALSSCGTLLLVEDNPEVAAATVPLIEEIGFRLRLAENAEAALAVIAGGGVDVVVSDIVMAGPMDGFQLGRAIREKHPEMPIVLVTGYNDRSEVARAEFTVLRKPYSIDDLGRAIAKVSATQASNVVRMPASPARHPRPAH